jgi:CBS domain-containing protein
MKTDQKVSLKVADVMTKQVLTVLHDASLTDAVRLMLKHRISAVPVVTQEGKLCGLLSEGDLLRREEIGTETRRPRWMTFLLDPDEVANDFVRTHGRKVSHVMTHDVVWISDAAPLTDAIEAMEKCHIKRLPVMCDERLVGILTRADVLNALLAGMTDRSLKTESDRAIRRMVGDALHRLSWPNGRPQFQVHEGTVDLYWVGRQSDWERNAARVAAETVEGVREVREHRLEA